MKLLTIVSLLILCSSANAFNKCHFKYKEKVVESLNETIVEIIEELEIAKTSSLASVLEDLRQSIEGVLEELSYILDLLAKIDKEDLDKKELKDALGNYSKSLKDLEAWNEVNGSNRRKRQTSSIATITTTLNDLSTTNTNTATTLQAQDPTLAFCPTCGTLIPLSPTTDPRNPATLGFISSLFVDRSVLFPGVANLPSCDGNRPARISELTAYAPCAFQEQTGANGSYYCNHPALKWITSTMANAYTLFGAVKVTKGSGDTFLVARFNFTKDGMIYSTIGYYFIYDFSIEFWDGTQAIRSTNYPNSFDILVCRLKYDKGGSTTTTKLPCRWGQTNITDANGNYLKTACIIPLAHTQRQAFFYCQSIGWKLYNIQSEDERAKLSNFILSVQPGIYNIDGRKGLDGTWYCGFGDVCFLQPLTTQWPNGTCMAFSFDGYQNHYAISSDCDNNKFYSICQ